MNLSALIRARFSEAIATAIPAIPAIPATKEPLPDPTVATVATIAVATPAGALSEAVCKAPCTELDAASHTGCDARGDSNERRRALLADRCAELAEQWPELNGYFWPRAESMPTGGQQSRRWQPDQLGEAPVQARCGEYLHFQPSPYNPTGGMGTCAVQAEAQRDALLVPWTTLKCKMWSVTTGGRRVMQGKRD